MRASSQYPWTWVFSSLKWGREPCVQGGLWNPSANEKRYFVNWKVV